MLEPIDDYNDLMQVIERDEINQAGCLATYLDSNLSPKSVIDIGCGPGLYLTDFMLWGTDILGIDGCSSAGRLIPNHFELVDLRLPYSPPKRYDLAICIEVAEHLQEKYSDTLIDTICNCSDVVCFTAAIPGQDGYCHWNCQPFEYWQQKFAVRGYQIHPLEQSLREYINQLECQFWLKQNIRLFSRIGESDSGD